MRKWLILIMFFLYSTFSLMAQERNKIIDLSGEWKFSIGGANDNYTEYQFDDSKWERIKVPSPWERQGFYGYNGYAYYRKEVYISNDYEGLMLYLRLGYIDDVDKVYFNGESIGSSGSFPPTYRSAYNALREYQIPGHLIKYGQKNIIAVKIYDSEAEGGIVSGEIGIFVGGMPVKLDLNLQGKWKFKTDDNQRYKDPEYDDSGWRKIYVPSYWENQGYQYFDQVAWYRLTFNYRMDIPGDRPVLVMGKIDDIDEVYLNGVLIGGTGSFKNNGRNTCYNDFRGYYFNKKLLNRNGSNTISVRVKDFGGEGGIYEGPVGIISQDRYIDFWRKKKSHSH